MKKSLRENLQAFLLRVHLLRCRNIKRAKGECVLNQIVFAAGVLLFPAVCTTLGAAGAGITQMITVVVADKIHKYQYIRSLKPLIA